MQSSKQEERRVQIEDAAYRMLGEKGYAGTSMLAIARAAKASNETLYNWYGDKKGLMAALVARNTETVRATLAENVSGDPMDHLARLGPVLLAMVLGPRAVALNRAAAADPSGDLGRAISEGGREVVAPLVTQIMVRAVADGSLQGEPEDLAQLYLTLLIGDQQIRRVTGAMEAPTPEQNAKRSEEALATLQSFNRGESNVNENWYFYLYQ
jgi:AcrR family transcriptional regulator